MTHLLMKHSLKALFLLILLISCLGPASRSARMSSAAVQKSPFRLRLKVENNTVIVGQPTQISALFLDPDYVEVPNDGTREIEFRAAATSTSGGAFSQDKVTVRPGEKSAPVKFTARQAGKIIISAHTAGLASAQTVLLARPQPGSYLSQLSEWFEPVAYAESPLGLDVTVNNNDMPANGDAKASFQVSYLGTLETDLTVMIKVPAPAALVSAGGKHLGVTNITLQKQNPVSDPIDVVSKTAGPVIVEVLSVLEKNKRATLNFTAPRPKFLQFKDDVKEIEPYGSTALIHVYVTDGSGKEVPLEGKHQIKLSSSAPITFDKETVELTPDQGSAESRIRLTGLPPGELKIRRQPQDDYCPPPVRKSGRVGTTVRTCARKLCDGILCAALWQRRQIENGRLGPTNQS